MEQLSELEMTRTNKASTRVQPSFTVFIVAFLVLSPFSSMALSFIGSVSPCSLWLSAELLSQKNDFSHFSFRCPVQRNFGRHRSCCLYHPAFKWYAAFASFVNARWREDLFQCILWVQSQGGERKFISRSFPLWHVCPLGHQRNSFHLCKNLINTSSFEPQRSRIWP